MHINRKPISESVEDAMKDKNLNVKRMRSLKPQPRTDIVMADALEASDEFDTHAKKVFGDLEKQSKNLTPKEPTTGKKINRKPYTEGFVLNEDLFEDVPSRSGNKPSKELLKYAHIMQHDVGLGYDVLKAFVEYGARRIGQSFEDNVGRYITDGREFPNGLWENEADSDVEGFDEALDISNDDDFDIYSDLNSAVYNALADVLYELESKGTKVSPANMETCFEWFLTHFFNDDGSYLDESLHKDLTGCTVTLSSSARDYFDEEDDAYSYIGSDGTLISHDHTSGRCKVRFSDGHTITVPFEYLEVDESCLDESKISGKNSKHIQKASKKSFKLKEAKIEGNDLWQAYGEDDGEPEQDTVYDFANERLFGVNYSGFVNSGNYRATNKFCRDVWVSLIKPKGAISARKNFYYPDNLAGYADFDGRESSTESRRAPTSEGISIYLRDESEDTLARAVADELELDYKIKPIGSYNKTNYKYIATVVIPDYIAEMPIDEYLTTIGKSISDYKGSGRGHRAKKRELVAV